MIWLFNSRTSNTALCKPLGSARRLPIAWTPSVRRKETGAYRWGRCGKPTRTPPRRKCCSEKNVERCSVTGCPDCPRRDLSISFKKPGLKNPCLSGTENSLHCTSRSSRSENAERFTLWQKLGKRLTRSENRESRKNARPWTAMHRLRPRPPRARSGQSRCAQRAQVGDSGALGAWTREGSRDGWCSRCLKPVHTYLARAE